MRRRLVALLVVAVLLFAFWWQKRSASQRGSPMDAPPQASVVPITGRALVPSARPVPQRVAVQILPPSDGSPAPQADESGFEGRVVSSGSGEGVDGAHLTFEHGGRTWSVLASANGAFRFRTDDVGRWWLAAVTGPGHLPFAPEWGQSPVLLQVRKGEVIRGITVVLSPAVEFEGKVVDPEERPVAGATIAVLGGGAGTNTLVPLNDRYTSDANGVFRFVGPQDAVVEATHPGFARGRSSIDYAARLRRKVTIRLKPLGQAQLTIEGSVVDHEGSPAEGATVSAALKRRPGLVPATARVDLNGRFQLIDLEPGTWKVTASRSNSAPAFAEIAAGTKGVLLRLARGGELAGRVREKRSGSPVAPFTILVQGTEMRSVSVVDPSGEYHLFDLAPGPAVVSVVAPGYAPSSEIRVTVPEAGAGPARADFDLTKGGRLSGVVVDQKTGAPLGGALVEVEGTPPSLGVPIRNETKTDGEGRFVLTGLAENTTGLQVSASGHHARIVAVPPIPDGEERGPLRIDLSPLKPGEQESVEVTGIGAMLEKSGDAFVVAKVAPTSGAAEAGLAEGDAVIAIEGRLTQPMTLGDAVSLIRGPEGTAVTLVVQKSGNPQAAVTLIVVRRVVRG